MKFNLAVAVLTCTLYGGSIVVSADTNVVSTNNVNSYTISPLIFGGSDAPKGDYPWMVALMTDFYFGGGNQQFCGGVLIAPDVVLTAAHCAELVQPFLSTVVVGVQDLDKVGYNDEIYISEVHFHPNYIADAYFPVNDIAILKLFSPAPFPTIPIFDASAMDQLAVGELMTHMGWGLRDQYTSSPGILQDVQLPLVDQMVCDEAYVFGSLGENQFCAGYAGGGKSGCYGDSGGPMVKQINGQWHLTGIVSRGVFEAGCAEPGNYNIFMKVSNYQEWIYTVINQIFINVNQDPIVAGISESNEWNVNIMNMTNEVANITDFALDGDTAAFTIKSNNCLVNTILPGQECTLPVKFSSKTPGSYSLSLAANLSSGASVNQVISATAFDQIEANTALDTHEWTWYSGGGAVWNVDPMGVSINGSALRSGAVEIMQSSTLLTYIEGPGTLSFNWKISDLYNDILEFRIDNKLIKQISEDQDWTVAIIHLDSGTHAVQWSHYQEFYFPSGNSAGWLDNIVWTRDNN